jgi:hypothetical protein
VELKFVSTFSRAMAGNLTRKFFFTLTTITKTRGLLHSDEVREHYLDSIINVEDKYN